MEKCLQCDKVLQHIPGRRQKSFCDANCRNKYFYAKRKGIIEAGKKLLAQLPSDYVEVKNIGVLTKDGEIKPLFPKPHKKPKKKPDLNLTKSIDYQTKPANEPYDAPKVISDNIADPEREKIINRIAVLEKELKSPPTSAIIGVTVWKRVREKELQELKNQLNK